MTTPESLKSRRLEEEYGGGVEEAIHRDLTVFPWTEFPFSSGLDVTIGKNGFGGSHLLKMACSIYHRCKDPS
uniref:Uncharacterized protein n=1 Tax=Candidatus Kentrum sp. FW TaxID=2126338 RepID=A0A450SH92_9GAMM|nr:MAG: hypothetical protein BECKFW1821B_GA0114236_101229 [Candidatus Kentron sp. FW]